MDAPLKTPLTGHVFNIQKFAIHDGPRTRTIVFLKGCPLQCAWCSNPEGINPSAEVLYKEFTCIHCGACVTVCPVLIHSMNDGKHLVSRKITCIACGACEAICPNRALKVFGKVMTVAEVVQTIEEDFTFYLTSGGGVTFSGGEAGVQSEFVIAVSQQCRASGIHCAIETSGFIPTATLFSIFKNVNLVLYDIKHMDSAQHKRAARQENTLILDNLAQLLTGAAGHNASITVRIPLIPSINDSFENLMNTALFINKHNIHNLCTGIDILPYPSIWHRKICSITTSLHT